MRSAPKSIGVGQFLWKEDKQNVLQNPNFLQMPQQNSGKQTQRKRSAKKIQKSTSAESQQQSEDIDNWINHQNKKRVHDFDDLYDDDDIQPLLERPKFGEIFNEPPIQNNRYAANMDPFYDDEFQIDQLMDERNEPKLESVIQFPEQPIFNFQEKKEVLPGIDNQIQENFVSDWCGFCDSPISDYEQQQGNYTILQSSDCFHNAHKECLKHAILKKRAENGYLNCPLCDRNINDYELKTYVSEAEWKEVNNFEARQILMLDPNLKQCECGNIIEFVKGEVNLGQKDDKGQLLSVEAATHMAEYRIRCNECQRNFCHKCKASPYHLGKTCDQLNNIQCRFCLEELQEWNQNGGPAFFNVCQNQECQDLITKSCDKVKDCGHPCYGIRGEQKCLPCLEPECIAKMDIHQAPNVDKDEYCSICYTSGLSQMPCIQLDCDHIVHHDCVIEQVNKGWNGARIVFNYLDCSQCKREMSCSNSLALQEALKPQLKFKQTVLDKAKKRAEYDNLQKDEKFLKPGNPYGGDLQAFAMNTLSYYQCFKCKDAYFVGRKDCAEGAQADVNNLNKETLMCPKCAPKALGGGITDCPTHGTDYIEFKCKFCCKRAIWFCWGNTHFCDPCHRKAYTIKNVPRDQLPKCQGKDCEIKMAHPAAGEEFALGCGLCAERQEVAVKNLDF